ncbi:DNA (cytosine-5)-methyltransferase 3B [Kryptolebias marmoratus]|uniref:DNA (cytosine-5)-methyltransferase 3B n=1 Tax=Kryptolebias marmoratus TaxID=37003 RepID=UPI0007F8B237|nr:DNA (cytosine-5)-methyltransferase 3B [Kryptolebias marmoratus]
MDCDTEEEPTATKTHENKNSDVIFLISEDEEEKADQMEIVVKDEPGQPHQTAEAAVKTQSAGGDLVTFIKKHCCNNIYSAHPKDLVHVVSNTPFCLYLYVGVPVGGGQSTSFVLIGYFDARSDDRVVKLVHTLQMNVDTADPHNSAGVTTDELTHAAYSDACLLIETLNKLELPLSNLAVFYCSAPHPELSQLLVPKLQTFNPKMISLCNISGMAGRACQGALIASFSHVVDLIRDIHHHYSTCSPVDDSLKKVFAEAGSYNPLCPVSAQCLFITHSVQNMAACWQDLLEYFKLLTHSEATDQIRFQLMDDKVKLHFLFLSHSLEPLRALQDLQQSGSASLIVELQLVSILLQSYATSILRSSAVDNFLLKRDMWLLHSEKELLPTAEVKVGSRASDFLWATSLNRRQQVRNGFLKDAQSFYIAALQSLVKSIPGPLWDVTQRNIGPLLKDPNNITDKSFSWKVLSVICISMGLCPTEASEMQLAQNYHIFIKRLKEKQNSSHERNSWAKILHRMRPWTTLHQLFLTLLALPSSLQRTLVFDKAYENIKIPHDREETPKASPQPDWWARRPSIRRRKLPVQKTEEGGESSTEGSDSHVASPRTYNNTKHCGSVDNTDYTDNSSDVIDITEESIIFPNNEQVANGDEMQQAEYIFIVTSDEENPSLDSPVSTSGSVESSEKTIGELVWGQIEGFSPWPGIIVPYKRGLRLPEKRMVEWYGQRMCSQVSLQTLQPYSEFDRHFCAKSFATLVTYREAIFSSLQEAALRCKKQFSPLVEDSEDKLKEMLDWAFGGFQPSGPNGLKPTNGVFKKTTRPKVKKKLFKKATSFSDPSNPLKNNGNIHTEIKDVAVSLNRLSCKSIYVSSQPKTAVKKRSKSQMEEERHQTITAGMRKRQEEWEGEKVKLVRKWVNMKSGWGRKRGKEGKGVEKKYNWFYGLDNDRSPDFVPHKKRSYTRAYNKVNQMTSVYTQPDQKLREQTINRIMDLNLNIEAYCLCCGVEDIEIFHPLFKGSLCLKCKNNFTETLFRYDEDGYQSYCTICCYGMEVILCGNDSCCRSYCEDCLNILAGPGTFDSLKLLDPWICYLCQPHQPHGALVPREDWSIRVQGLFANNSGIEFEPHRVYPSIPASLRRPLRVLSLFDGIGTGYLVLKDLGFKVDKYVASEVCEDSIAVSTINHDGKIVHVGDVRFITQEHINDWGPFDLMIGGSPCNDLSIVNPLRKGLYEGTGRLFFEYYRILQLLKPKEEDPRPFFWLFENVVFMNTHDKVNICRFFECNPVLVDAVKVSPAHRARYFWGNIPGMSRPIIASQTDKLNLQDCLELGREAKVTKVRTITTNPNSLKQGKDVSQLPVLESGREDTLWITELEKIFGFPKHYTDVRNMNRQQRQKLLGKAWSVPVIRHLFAPLKDYFACEELPPLSTACMPACSSNTSSSCPATPDLQQLR